MPSLGLGLGTNRINPLFRGLLNEYSGAAAAYSLEKLSSGTNNVVRVRRSSDDAESDFTAQQVSDGTLTTWTGANDGFVVTWYDQSGNSNDATQATAASQPKIVSAGTYLGEVDFDGTDDYLETSGTVSFTQPTTAFTVVNNDVTFFGGIATLAPDINTTSVWSVFVANTNNAAQLSSAYLPSSTGSHPINTYVLSTFLTNSTASKFWFDGVEDITGDAGSVNPSGKLSLGSVNSGSGPLHLKGQVKEVIIYDSDQSANRTGIEANINGRYSIY